MRASIVYLSFLRGERRHLTAPPEPVPAVLTLPGQPSRFAQLLAWLTPDNAAAPDLAEVRIPGAGRMHVAAAHVRPQALPSAQIIPFPGRRR